MREDSLTTRPFRYAAALGATALVAAVGTPLSRALGDPAPLTLFVVASIVSAWYGGLGPGLLATVLGALAGSYFTLEPLHSLAIARPADQVRLGTFLLAGGVVSWLSEALHRSRREARTEARQAEEALAQLATERARLLAIVESIPAGVVVAEAPSGRIVLGNKQAEQALGHPLIPTTDIEGYRQWRGRDLKGRRLEPEEYPLVRALHGEAGDQEFLYEQDDGSRKRLQASWVPICNAGGLVAGGVVLFSDVSRERQAQEALRSSERRLEVALTAAHNLEESLLRQTEALQEADRHKNEFLAILAHELRNPLAPIQNALQILALRGGDPEVVAQARELMERQVGQMTHLVDDLLEISRISRGKIKLQKVPLDLSGVVATAVETSRPLIEARHHELTVTPPARPVRVDADPARLAQVLANLLNNAAKYTEVGGRIHVTAGLEDGKAVLRVRDTGAGIAPEMLPQIFDLFTQIDGTLDRSQGGLGIGLTLARRLVEIHGGTIEAHSDGIGQGSEFVVRLPALAEEIQACPELPAAPVETEGARRILIVDDNMDSAESLAMLLQLYGHDVRLAHDGEAALEEVRAFSPDTVLLDIGLPKLDGYGVAERLRASGLDGMTLIAMTGYGQDEDRRRSREAGFHFHLVKPLDLDALQRLLATAPEPAR